jgi:regulator of ribosome biosynthesis
MDQIDNILAKIDEDELKAKETISVKGIHESSVQFDVGNLALIDLNELNNKEYKNKSTDFINNRARDLTQLFINKLWSNERSKEDKQCIDLPDNLIKLPRMLEYVQKQPTKWEQFAKKKGIVRKKKRDNLVYDDEDGVCYHHSLIAIENFN